MVSMASITNTYTRLSLFSELQSWSMIHWSTRLSLKKSNANELKSDYKADSNNKSGNNNSTNLITALVKFEKGDSVS
jgi:hypothetical protein